MRDNRTAALESKLKALADMLDKYAGETTAQIDTLEGEARGTMAHGQMLGAATAQRNAARWIRVTMCDVRGPQRRGPTGRGDPMRVTIMPLSFGETIEENFTDPDGHPGCIVHRATDGAFIARQWDDAHGWGDRAYKTIEECRFHASR